MAIKLQCKCGKTFELPTKLAGEKIRCKDCGKLMKVPSQAEDFGEKFATDPDDPLAVKGHRRCPECGKSYPKNDTICVACGINLETGAQLYASMEQSKGELKRPSQPSAPGLTKRLLRLLGMGGKPAPKAPAAPPAAEKPGKKKKKK